jgi:hypothetical protein
MLMPKKNLVAIYEHLFTEGVIVAMKDTHAPKHPGKKLTLTLKVSDVLFIAKNCLLAFLLCIKSCNGVIDWTLRFGGLI